MKKLIFLSVGILAFGCQQPNATKSNPPSKNEVGRNKYTMTIYDTTGYLSAVKKWYYKK
jgi:hypothetical protein